MWFSLVIVSSSASFTTRCWGWYSFTLVMLILIFFVFSLQLCDKTSVESFLCQWRIRNYQREKKLIKTRWRSWKVPEIRLNEESVSDEMKILRLFECLFSLLDFFLCASISIKTSESCTEILFHLRDFSPIFHFYRTSFAGSFCGFFNFDISPLIFPFFFAQRNETSWLKLFFSLLLAAKHVIVRWS